MEKGYLALVLHAHLPFVRHPEYDEFLEERWFFEALTETYIPLLAMFENLRRDRVPFHITINMSPSLCNMLDDELLKDRYERYLNNMVELCEREIDRTRFSPEFYKIALMYYHRFSQAREKFLKEYNRDLLYQFKKYQDKGYLVPQDVSQFLLHHREGFPEAHCPLPSAASPSKSVLMKTWLTRSRSMSGINMM